MAAVTAQQISKKYVNEAPDRAVLYEISNISAEDTVDVGPSGVASDFRLVKQAAMLATTVSGGMGDGLVVDCAGGINGTVITLPAGLANDAGYLLVWGDTN